MCLTARLDALNHLPYPLLLRGAGLHGAQQRQGNLLFKKVLSKRLAKGFVALVVKDIVLNLEGDTKAAGEFAGCGLLLRSSAGRNSSRKG